MVNLVNCGGNATVTTAVNAALANVERITRSLRKCVRNKLNNATIECHNCEQPNLLGWNDRFTIFGVKLWASDTFHLCINNIGNNANRMRDVILHEFAHSCCWDHGNGHGVSGNSGTIP